MVPCTVSYRVPYTVSYRVPYTVSYTVSYRVPYTVPCTVSYRLLDGLIQRRDPRTRDYLMQASPVPLGIALAAYLVLVGYGPRFMKNRPTPPLRLTMMLYNIGQVILSGYMMWEFLASRPRHSWACAPVEVTPDPVSLRLVNACWLFHVSKLVDFLDTVFLVLKKDNKRMTYLHVYHHGSMASGWWICTLYLPGAVGFHGNCGKR
ncbi:Elongation of very long chain fatty acids protein 7 [Amphibalanus amphitrite]|uniref:Elongation of very long chain fatty acids protein n=1 Tax=Amphibalanus amphitrite TaxID=1232801 RepID=A0A6A4W720_AMPAM|nr:Elongation of very long chain fatty acids protein 7 [Amphibalanus amphitrite]